MTNLIPGRKFKLCVYIYIYTYTRARTAFASLLDCYITIVLLIRNYQEESNVNLLGIRTHEPCHTPCDFRPGANLLYLRINKAQTLNTK